MRRFEFVEGTSSKFWEAEVSGNTLKICYGKIGTAGKAETRLFGSEAAAHAEADKLIREKTRKGYKEVATAVPAAGAQDGKELEQAIWDNPDDDTVWQVYADWLQQQNNPFGEYISLSIAGKSQATAKKAADAILEKNSKKWLGKLYEQEYVSLGWHNGMLKSASVSMEWDGEPDVNTLLKALLPLEIAKFLQTLRVGIPQDDGDNNTAPLATALVKGGVRRGLKTLYFPDFTRDECEVSWASLADITPFATIFPDLEQLTIKGAGFKLGPSSWPNLTSFTIITGGLPSLDGIIKAQWPKLKRLEIWFGREYYGGKVKVMDLIPLLKRKDMPLLKHLGLVNHELGDKVMELVLDSPLLPQLESLDLSKSSLGDKAASLILASQDKLKHLKSVDLSENFISDTLSEQLAALPGYKLNGQRNLEEYDYYEENDENGEPKRYCVLGE